MGNIQIYTGLDEKDNESSPKRIGEQKRESWRQSPLSLTTNENPLHAEVASKGVEMVSFFFQPHHLARFVIARHPNLATDGINSLVKDSICGCVAEMACTREVDKDMMH